MASIEMSTEDMLRRVARFEDLEANTQAFVDSRIPGHERNIYNVIGTGVNEDPETEPAIAAAEDFTITYIGAEPGKGAALHAHPTVEVFVPITGSWAIYWGGEGGQQLVLGQADVISVPPGVMRGFRNAGEKYAYLMAIIGGGDSGKVTWGPGVLARAAKTGLTLDGAGNLVDRGG